MLGKFLKVDGVQMPNPVKGTWNDGLNPVENVFQSESGRRMTNVVRLDRYSFSCSFNCSSKMKWTILNFCMKPSVIVTVNGVNHKGTLRTSSSSSLVENSEYCRGTDGLWVVPVVFEEE